MKRSLLTLVLLCAAGLVCAEDDPFAAFEGLEAAAEEMAEKEEVGLAGKVIENLTGTAKLQYTHYFNDPAQRAGVDPKNDFLNYSVEFETWTGEGNWRVDATGWMQGGNQEGTFDTTNLSSSNKFFADEEDRQHRYFTLNEIYFTYTGESADVTLGRKVIKNGLSTIYSPANNLSTAAAFDPLDTHELGVWQLRTDWYVGDYTLTAAVLPVFAPEKSPPPSSRWVGSNNTVPTGYPDTRLADMGYFGRIKTTQSGWDLFASLYTGYSHNYVFNQIDLERQPVWVVNPAIGYSTTVDKWEFHGETSYIDSRHGRDDSFFSTVQGVTYTIDDAAKKIGLEQIETTFEYAIESITQNQNHADYGQNSRNFRSGQNDLIGRIRFKYDEDLDFEYNGHVQLRQWGYMNRFQVNWEVAKNTSWKTGIDFFGGKAAAGGRNLNAAALRYGNWKLNNRVYTALEYSF
jgi:hypothetical protein